MSQDKGYRALQAPPDLLVQWDPLAHLVRRGLLALLVRRVHPALLDLLVR